MELKLVEFTFLTKMGQKSQRFNKMKPNLHQFKSLMMTNKSLVCTDNSTIILALSSGSHPSFDALLD